ncbi:MAG: autotransporter domain-containing protein [Rhodanobacter sp.]
MNTTHKGLRRREAALAVTLALGLVACGGGGGNVRPVPVTPTTPPAPPTPTPPPRVDPPVNAQLALTNTYVAHDRGLSGTGVTIGVVDSGIMRSHPALVGRVIKELIYIDPARNNTAIDDVVGHGTWVSEIAAGTAVGQFAGGIAPGAKLVSARIISDAEPKDDGSGQGNEVTSSDPLGTINADLMANGVRVMNNSWGGLYWSASATATTKSFHDAYAPFINGGGLVVFASGNADVGNPNPTDTAALPTRAPDLEKGWLAVTALDSNSPTKLAVYANACGVAANYCLAAPGDVIVSGKDDTASNLSYYVVRGTSLAAPQVSGAAALVWEQFPYFDNDLVRQTLLGTATDLGAPGVDPVFGYGGLNVGRAVDGPMQFNWGDVTVDFSGDSSWNNPISGAGGLTKRGSGRLFLTQPSTYTGLTQVQSGTLVAKSLAGGASIGASGLLTGATGITGNVSNAGTLSVVGTDLNLTGNYTQVLDGKLALTLGSALRVTGSATLNGSNLLVLGANSGYVANAHTDVLTAAGGLTGQFGATVDKGSNVTLLTSTWGYDATSAWLNVTQVQATAVQGMTYTPASWGAAQRVDGAFAQINAQLGENGTMTDEPAGAGFIHGAANLQQSASLGVVQKSLESLSGQLHAASAAMTFEAIDAGTRALSDRFDTLQDARQAGAWTQSLGYHGDMARNGYRDVGYDLSGWLLGQDYRFGEHGVAGYAMSRSQGLGRLAESADQGNSRAFEGMLYGGVMRGAWYTMGRFGVGDYRQTTRRQIQLGSQYSGVASDSSGRYGVAYGESGYRLTLGGARLTPYLSLQYAQIHRSGFDEIGADGFGLKSSAQTTARWQAGAGVRAEHEWALANGQSVSLQGRMSWQQAFGLRGEVFDASFSGINQFAPVGGIGLSRFGGVVGTSLNWKLAPRASVQLGYDQYLGQRQQARMATAAFNWTF